MTRPVPPHPVPATVTITPGRYFSESTRDYPVLDYLVRDPDGNELFVGSGGLHGPAFARLAKDHKIRSVSAENAMSIIAVAIEYRAPEVIQHDLETARQYHRRHPFEPILTVDHVE